MKRLLKNFFTVLSTSAVMFGSAIAGAADKDIVDTAVSAGSFKTLAAALQAADLVDALKGDGPFTVFAPTDEAFAKLPAGTVESLLKPENRKQLVGVLTYHVVDGKVPAKQVVDLKGAKTLNGQRVDITVANGTVTVDKAKVVTTDIKCSNGIIHVIDSVILPSADNIATTADKAGTFKTLLAAAKAAGLATALSGEAELTVFAPTDEAFAKLPAGTVESLLKPENKAKLAGILKYHVVTGRVYSGDAVQAKVATTLQGSTIAITLQDGKARVNDANLVATDIDASNGVIHVIDSVMLPPESKKVTAVEASQLILGAIAQGAPTYNAGHHEACAQLYMTTASSLVSEFSDLPPHVVTNLKHVVTQAQHTSCPTDRAWTLRNGLDQAYISMTNVR